MKKPTRADLNAEIRRLKNELYGAQAVAEQLRLIVVRGDAGIVKFTGWTLDNELEEPPVTITIRRDLVVWWRVNQAWDWKGRVFCDLALSTIGASTPMYIRFLHADLPLIEHQLEGGR